MSLLTAEAAAETNRSENASAVETETAISLTETGSQINTQIEGNTFSVKAENATGAAVEKTDERAQESVDMYRLYNPHTGEHFYTHNEMEMINLITAGWDYEGIGWRAPLSGDPVFRMYNPNAGDHHYTTDEGERDFLTASGWNYEGIGWYSGGNFPLYRQYNPNAVSGSHNYTTGAGERDLLVAVGWNDEGIGWYAMEEGTPCQAPSVSKDRDRNLFLIGDSRTVGMCNAMTGSAYYDQNVLVTVPGGTTFSCQGGKRYYEMRDYLVPQIEGQINASSDVVILMGVNDCWNGGIQEETLPQYVDYLNRKAAEWKARGARVYFCSVLPVRGDFYLGAYMVNNQLICRFNDYIRTRLTGDIEYIDLYSKMIDKIEYVDAVHYTAGTYLEWYDAIIESIRKSEMVSELIGS